MDLLISNCVPQKNYSKFGLSRTLNQIGAELTVTSGREHTTYLLESTRNNLSRGIDILAEVISRPELRPWEMDNAHARLEFDLDVYDEKPELSKLFIRFFCFLE
jgi:ubiquinol-cytochrome c reductase core subunit 2